MTIYFADALLAFAILTVGGWAFVAVSLGIIRTHVFRKRGQFEESFGRLDFWLGSIERLVATMMFVWGIASLPAFIGAWIAFKLAANWQRIKSQSDEVRKGTLIALVGNVLSFSLAIGVGYFLNPHAIAHFTK